MYQILYGELNESRFANCLLLTHMINHAANYYSFHINRRLFISAINPDQSKTIKNYCSEKAETYSFLYRASEDQPTRVPVLCPLITIARRSRPHSRPRSHRTIWWGE